MSKKHVYTAEAMDDLVREMLPPYFLNRTLMAAAAEYRCADGEGWQPGTTHEIDVKPQRYLSNLGELEVDVLAACYEKFSLDYFLYDILCFLCTQGRIPAGKYFVTNHQQ